MPCSTKKNSANVASCQKNNLYMYSTLKTRIKICLDILHGQGSQVLKLASLPIISFIYRLPLVVVKKSKVINKTN